jgi:hypothetical protein
MVHNPHSPPKNQKASRKAGFFCFQARQKLAFVSVLKTKKAKVAQQLSFLDS